MRFATKPELFRELSFGVGEGDPTGGRERKLALMI